MPRIFLFIIMPLLYGIAVFGEPISFRHIGINQGLSNNSIRCIFQDYKGFMWFGTYDGLDRFDGYNFKTFRNKIGDSTSLSHNYINTITGDLHGNLFVGTGQGLSIYNNLAAKFSPGLYISSSSKQKRRISFNIIVAKTDIKGNVFIGTSVGLFVRKDGADAAIQLFCENDTQGISKNQIQAIFTDKKNNVWVDIAQAGIFLYDPIKEKLFSVCKQQLPTRCMETDNIGNLWIGTDDGLYKYDLLSHSLNRFTETYSKKQISHPVTSLAFDQQDKLWIGTEGGGLNILEIKTGKLENCLAGDGINDLSSETIYTIYQDAESRKWIGTHKGGLNIIDPKKNTFQTVSHNLLNTNSLAGNNVSSFYEDKNNNLWIGSDGGGISVWNRQTNNYTNYNHIPTNQKSLSNNAVPSIIEDYLGNIWIATFGNGIDRFNKSTQTFEHYACVNSQNGIENKYVWKLYEDRQHNLWATTFANGRLYKLNREADRFEMFSPDFIDLFTLLEDRSGDLWGGTAFGLCRIDKQHKDYQSFDIDKPVRAIFEDTKGQFWLGTEGLGLILFDRAKGKVIQSFNDSNSLCNNSVLNILGDDRDNLWLSTFHGLSRFSPVGKKFSNFYQEDGLQSNQFEYNAALRLRSGEMVFGGIGGFTIFSPSQIDNKTNTPPIFLTSIHVDNELVTKNSPYVALFDENSFKKLVVPYNEAMLSFDFTALEYSAPGKIDYAYYLEGWDKTWNYTNNNRTANYTKLQDGKYTLRIKCTNTSGIWSTQEVRLEILVLPPWYRSWWAYFIYSCIVVSIVLMYNAYRVRKAKLEYGIKLAHLQNEKEKELAQLEIQKEKEMNEKKLSFFTDVSHEFRTPLTLIINPLKDYITSSNLKQDKNDLNIVYRNARRLLSLVDQLLQFRKVGAEIDSLRLAKLDLCSAWKDVYSNFEKEIRSKRLSYRFICETGSQELYADHEKIEVIFYNLLSNAVKYTPEGGEITTTIVEKEQTLDIQLSDNGLGIPPEVGDRLFERFYRVQQNPSLNKPGFGIGLFLVKQFVEQHKGKITYKSTVGSGTTFYISFQKGRAHFGELPIYEDKTETQFIPVDKEESKANEPLKSALDDMFIIQQAMLIVDDNEQIKTYLSSIFSKDFTVYQASSGSEGIVLAKKYLPDIIVSDIMMDNGNGIELCEAIKNNTSLGHIPVILLTAVSDSDTRLKGTESGADDYITKPFEKDLLVAKVKALLQNRTKLQQYFFNEVTLKKQDFKIAAEYREFLDSCIAIVERNLEDDQFNIKKLSHELGMSHSALYRKVKSISGQSIAGFIRFIRLRKAAELMINSNSKLKEISYQVGMSDIKYFRVQFNALFGMNPSDYIKKYRATFIPSFDSSKNEGMDMED